MGEEQINEIISYLNDDETKSAIIFGNEEVEKNIKNKIAVLKKLSDEEKIKIVGKIELLSFKLDLMASLSNDEYKIQCLNEDYNDRILMSMLSLINDDNIKMQYIDKLEDSIKFIIIIKLSNDKLKLDFLDKVSTNNQKIEIIKSMSSDEIKYETLDQILDYRDKASIIASMSSDKLKFELLEQMPDDVNKETIIESMVNEDYIFVGISTLQSEIAQKNLIQKLCPDDMSKIKCIDRLSANMSKAFLMSWLSNDQLKIENLSKIKLDTFKSYVIASLNDDNLKVKCLMQLKDDDVREIYFHLRPLVRNSCDIETIKRNLDLFISFEIGENNVKYLKDILAQMEQKNDDVLKKINFNMLKDQYVKTLGVDRINTISCFPDIQNQILGLDLEEYKVFILCLKEYLIQEDKAKTSHDWTYMVELLLNNIHDYDKLIQDLKGKEYDINKLYMLIQNPNDFEINTIHDLENLEEIIKSKCDELITHENLEDKRLAVLQKVFGQSLTDAKKIIQKYGQDIDTIENQDLKDYVKCLKAIMSADVYGLDRIYAGVESVEKIHRLSIERSLRAEYGKKFNDGLLKIDKDYKYNGELLDAGTDFKMIITSVGAYVNKDCEIVDYKDNWNRKNLASPHFCTSYIRNDMLGTAPIPKFCYGFNEMSDNSLAISASSDLASNGIGFTSKTGREAIEKYYSPDNQINNTVTYNEMDFYRFQNGQKKQPDYIVVFKINGKIKNLDLAQKASKDWGGMPIVVVDVNKCLESERIKTEELLKRYEKEKNPEIARELYYKIKNNRKTVTSQNKSSEEKLPEFFPEIDEKKLEEMEKIFTEIDEKEEYSSIAVSTEHTKKESTERCVTEEDLSYNFELSSATERVNEVGKIGGILQQIQRLSRNMGSEEIRNW